MRTNIWKGSVSFGLLNIPVTLQSAQEEKELHFSMLDERDLSHIRYKKVNAQSGREVPSEKIVKGYEFKKGKFVIITDQDFEKANVKATKTIDIEDFVLLEEIDTMLFDRPYYLAPQKGAEKGYFLLREALADTEKVAIAKIVIRTKQHLCAVMAKGDYLVLELLRFSNQVKEVHEVDYLKGINKRVKFTPKELKMAEDLIAGMTAKWNPDKYKDTYSSDLMKRIKAKVKRGQGKDVDEAPEREEVEESSNVIDLLPLLQKSLEKGGAKKRRSPRKNSVRARAH